MTFDSVSCRLRMTVFLGLLSLAVAPAFSETTTSGSNQADAGWPSLQLAPPSLSELTKSAGQKGVSPLAPGPAEYTPTGQVKSYNHASHTGLPVSDRPVYLRTSAPAEKAEGFESEEVTSAGETEQTQSEDLRSKLLESDSDVLNEGSASDKPVIINNLK